MTDDDLRALVRDAVARHLSASPALRPGSGASDSGPVHDARGPAAGGATPNRGAAGEAHFSHALYLTLVNPGDACLIEPAVTCNHCGYCKSHGH
jgi:hypothetical protein